MNNQLTTFLIGLVVGAIVVGSYFYFDRSPTDPEIERLQEHVTLLETQLEQQTRERQRTDERAERAQARSDTLETRLQAVRDSVRDVTRDADTRAAQAGEELSASFDSLRVVVTPENVPLVDTTEAQVERRDRARLEVISALEVQVGAMDMRIHGLESVLEQREVQIAQRNLMLETLELRVEAEVRLKEMWEARYRSERRRKNIERGTVILGIAAFLIFGE